MKILYFITKSTWGGASRHVFDLATNLSRKEFDVAVALGGSGPLTKHLAEVGIRTISLEKLGRDIAVNGDLASFKEFYQTLKVEKPNVLHVHSPKAAGIGALAGRIARVQKIVYTVHGWTFNEDRGFLSRVAIKFLSWITILLSHKVILLGEREYDQVKHWPWVKDKLLIIRNGIARPSFLARTKARDFIAGKINKKIPKETLVLGTIGELHKNKGHEYLLEAFSGLQKSLGKVIGVIIGEGEERKNLESLIESKGLKDSIFLVGHVHNATLYLKGLDIFIFTSIKEGLPYAIIEAANASLPIITTNVGDIHELIDDMQSGILIKPKNVREIEESIRFLINHPQKMHEFGENAYKKIHSHYSLSKMLSNVTALYKSTPVKTHSS